MQNIDNKINEIQNGSRDIPQFNQPEHAGICSAGPLLIGAILVCNDTRKSLATGSSAPEGQGTIPNWEIDETQEAQLQQWAEAKNVWIPEAEDMHPANVFVEPRTGQPICIDCIVKFKRYSQP